MTVKDYLLQLKNQGHLSRLVKLGYCSPKASIRVEMWLCYNALRNASDKSEGEIVGQVCQEFNCSRSTFYRMLASFEATMKEK
jgi:AraC-like DNA-binding protein